MVSLYLHFLLVDMGGESPTQGGRGERFAIWAVILLLEESQGGQYALALVLALPCFPDLQSHEKSPHPLF